MIALRSGRNECAMIWDRLRTRVLAVMKHQQYQNAHRVQIVYAQAHLNKAQACSMRSAQIQDRNVQIRGLKI